jgi:hypothetical protein
MNNIHYAVKSDDLYHTGEFSRDLPPAAYLGTLAEAAVWETEESAQQWADEFGGTVVEIDWENPETVFNVEPVAIERDGTDCYVTVRIPGGAPFCEGWSLGETKFSLSVTH